MHSRHQQGVPGWVDHQQGVLGWVDHHAFPADQHRCSANSQQSTWGCAAKCHWKHVGGELITGQLTSG